MPVSVEMFLKKKKLIVNKMKAIFFFFFFPFFSNFAVVDYYIVTQKHGLYKTDFIVIKLIKLRQ